LMTQAGGQPQYEQAHAKALRWMLQNPIKDNRWSNYYEDVGPAPKGKRCNTAMAVTFRYLIRHAGEHPEYVPLAAALHAAYKEDFVYTDGHPFAPAPGVAEQGMGRDKVGCGIMPVHTVKYCLMLAENDRLQPDEGNRRIAFSGLNSISWAQVDEGGIATWLWDPGREKTQIVDEAGFRKYLKERVRARETWYSIHIATLGWLIEAISYYPQLAPAGEDHLLATAVPVRSVTYERGRIAFATGRPSSGLARLSFVPRLVKANGTELARHDRLAADGKQPGWSFDQKAGVLRINHPPGAIEIAQ
jgi:hypothetical protein